MTPRVSSSVYLIDASSSFEVDVESEPGGDVVRDGSDVVHRAERRRRRRRLRSLRRRVALLDRLAFDDDVEASCTPADPYRPG